jgi:hypothetical protein
MTAVVLVLHGTVDALDMIEAVLSEVVNTLDIIEMVLEIWKYGGDCILVHLIMWLFHVFLLDK